MKNTALLVIYFLITFNSFSQITETVIGNTTYPLQSEGSMPRRIILNPDGSISATWRFSLGFWNSWSESGTGYNFFNGTNWNPIPTSRTETDRTFHNSISITGNGKEMCTSEFINYSANVLINRPAYGTGGWIENNSFLPDPLGFNASSLTYASPQHVIGGTDLQTIHHLSLVRSFSIYDSPYFRGQYGTILYSRSINNGMSFDIQNIIIPAFDSTHCLGYKRNEYAIDAHENTVAIVAGGPGKDIIFAKSTDNGNTWNHQVLESFPIPFYDVSFNGYEISDINSDMIADTIISNDGTFSILVDNNQLVHIWWGKSRLYDNDDPTTNHYIGTRGLMYWNENMALPQQIADVEDINSNTLFDATGWGRYNQSLTSQATSGIDGDNNIFVAYSSVLEDTDDGSGNSFRGLYLIGSTNSGTSWTSPFRIFDSNDFRERVFPSMTRNVRNNKVRMIYQSDNQVGHGVGFNNPDESYNQGITNDIVYIEIPTSNIGITSTIGNENIIYPNLNIYPNPTSQFLVLSKIPEGTQAIVIYDLSGKMIKNITQNINETTSIPTHNFEDGFYLINILGENFNHTSKFIVKH